MSRAYQVTGVLLALFSALWMWQSSLLRLYTPNGPGPGFFPFWLSLLLGLLSFGMVYDATRHPMGPLPAGFFPDRVGLTRIGAILLAVGAVIVFLQTLGFRLTMLAFWTFLLLVLGRVHPLVIVLVALAGSVGVFYVFVEGLQVPLPVGTLGI